MRFDYEDGKICVSVSVRRRELSLRQQSRGKTRRQRESRRHERRGDDRRKGEEREREERIG